MSKTAIVKILRLSLHDQNEVQLIFKLKWPHCGQGSETLQMILSIQIKQTTNTHNKKHHREMRSANQFSLFCGNKNARIAYISVGCPIQTMD